jgi:Mg2+ and Co2+ transporter CorA
MRVIVLSPDAPPGEVQGGPVELDASDSKTLTWVDLDRSETPDLPELPAGIPVPLARELLDPSPTAQVAARGAFRRLSILGVRETPEGPDLADLDIVVGRGLLVTVHTGDRPALRRLGDPATWRQPLAPPLSEATLVRIVEATLDAYDDLIDHAEEEIQRLQDASTTGDARAALLRDRRRLAAIRRRLASERGVFGDVARPGPATTGDASWWILDRLETAIAAAQAASDYALAASWAVARDSRRRPRELALVLSAAWVTLVVVALIGRASRSVGMREVDSPILFAGGVLALVTMLVAALAWSRRWS